MSAYSPAAATFDVGQSVKIVGLASRADLNGSVGVLTTFDTEKDRWGVQLEGDKRCLAVKTSNLLQVSGSLSNTSLRGGMRGRSNLLCRYGQSCWRPCCIFRHENETARAKEFLNFWTSDALELEPSVLSPPTRELPLSERIDD